jgi:hypothetical protein
VSAAGTSPPPPVYSSELVALQRENRELREALGTRPVIEQAKGALIWRFGLSDDAAFAVLRRWSQNSNVKLHTIADVLVNVVCRGDTSRPRVGELASWVSEQMGEQAVARMGEQEAEPVGEPQPVPAG